MSKIVLMQYIDVLQGFMNRFQMYVHPVVAVPKHSQHIFANDLVKEVITDVR